MSQTMAARQSRTDTETDDVERERVDNFDLDLSRYRIGDLIDFHTHAGEENWVTAEVDTSYRSYHSERLETRTFYVDPRYDRVSRKSHNSQQECADAFARRAFPTHNMNSDGGAELYSSENYRAIQHSDGTGVINHYSTIAAIRTRHDLIVSNQQDWATGFATCTYPSATDTSAPLTGISELLDESDVDADIYDIESVHREETLRLTSYSGMREWSGDNMLVVLNPADGERFGVGVTRDATANDRVRCGFVLSHSELAELDHVGDILDLLVPDEVRTAGMEVVGVHQMSPHDSGSYYDRRGEVIQRQGEWFFIPTDIEPVGTVYKPRNGDGEENRLGNHEPTRLTLLRETCEECGATAWDWGDVLRCAECGDVPPPLVNGTVRHNDNDHPMARLGDTWHRAVEHERAVMTFEESPGRENTRRPERAGRWD